MNSPVLAIASVGLLAAGASLVLSPDGSMSKSVLSLPVPKPSGDVEVSNFFEKMKKEDKIYYVYGTKKSFGGPHRSSFAFPSYLTAKAHVDYYESIGFTRVSVSSVKKSIVNDRFRSWLTPDGDLASDIGIASTGFAGRILLFIEGVGHFDSSIVGNELEIRRIHTVNYLRISEKSKRSYVDTIEPFIHKVASETNLRDKEDLYRELHFLIGKKMRITD